MIPWQEKLWQGIVQLEKHDYEVLWERCENPLPAVIIICPAHPSFGGTFHHKVLTAISHAALSCGIHSLRLHYRGVGRSQGSYGGFAGECPGRATAEPGSAGSST